MVAKPAPRNSRQLGRALPLAWRNDSVIATYAGDDTIDKLVLALRRYAPAGIQDFSSFEAAHPTFLLYSNSSRTDWWPAKLAHDGKQLKLLSLRGRAAVYLVGPKVRTTTVD